MGRWSGILRVGGEDGVTWLGSLEEWSLRYEAEHAALDETTMQVAVGTINILFFNVPFFTRGFFAGAISAVLEMRTRTDMK